MVAAGRSLVAFLLGLLLAALCGAAALFLQQQPLWLCVYATVGGASLAAFGMGLWAGVRADTAAMLPSLCSARGRSLLLFLVVSQLLSGPLSNTLLNAERAAASLLCGAELTANQTQELLQRAATPLFPVLDQIQQISSNAQAAAGRVQNLISSLTDNVRHVARTLRNVLHFLAEVGDECNARLGAPYGTCRALFGQARDACSALLGPFSFLCDIMDGFLPLCGLARVGQLFCIVPSFIAGHLKERLAAPTVLAFERMKREFEFSVSASVTFDLEVNASRSLQQAAQQILREVSSQLQVVQRLSEPLAYGGTVLLAWAFLRAVRYRHRYLHQDDFDNIYITAQFEELDQRLARGGGASVLPLTRREATTYITPMSLSLTAAERRAVVLGLLSVLKHMVMGGLLLALDFLVFWMLDQVQQQAKGDLVARAPLLVAVRVKGAGLASDIFRDVAASFNVLQTGNITVISSKCLVQPAEPQYTGYYIIGFLYALALLSCLAGGFVQRCRRLICCRYHPEREEERIQFLHNHILEQRRTVGKVLRRSAARSRADGGGGGGGGGRSSLLRMLLLRIPGGFYLSDLLGLSSVSCLACGEAEERGGNNMVACLVPQCSGLYCRPCFHSLGSICVVCMGPLTFQEDSEEEL
ncbi:DC-STAMP domain-containing protein 2 [Centroberyx affinis]|uniref:DC-STAMP domain-containing protein 2 n=1 Tax=Centroberyx affinis TaxID=166261 RepID=UPI003A5BEAE0